MSTSSTTGQESRSPSPLTPEASDSLEPITIQSEVDQNSSWYLSEMHPSKSPMPTWVSDPSLFTTPNKAEDEQMLRLDELIEQHAYEDSPSSELQSTTNYSSPPSYSTHSRTPSTHADLVVSDFSRSNLLASSHHAPISITKPIPPPASLPRKSDPSSINQRVVFPPKEACFNLPIMFPSIPEGGTKSRVETQVRITVDLADSCSSSDSYKYDRVGSWKWLKLPQGTATKKRTRKQGKIDAEPQDILHLSATVTCATPPHNRVLSCSSCQTREAKRVAKKLAARVRPARSESESEGEGPGKPKSKNQEDTTSIIQFNCAEILDFSTGSIVLPLRITCYCRHHREKVGFNVHFSMMDHTGRIVGSGMTRPIMITDDHKTSTASKPPDSSHNYPQLEPHGWSQMSGMLNEVSSGVPPSRRKSDFAGLGASTKRRHKPYDSLAKPSRNSREGSTSSAASPSTTHSPLPTTRASTPASLLQNFIASDPPPASQPPPLHYNIQGSETSSPDSLATPLDHNSDVPMPQVAFDIPEPQPQHDHQLQPASTLFNAPIVPTDMTMANIAQPMPYLFFDPNPARMQVQLPIIHRLIPNSGPTLGGIEVTILGANFHPTVQLTCMFGDAKATSTQRWSDNTLVCILPPRAAPGVVPVWFDGFPKVEDSPPPPFFTYSDESDRALMELALQVVGLKMTGKIEDAKNVAMRIVNTTAGDGADSSNSASGMMQLSTSPSMRDLRPLLLARAGEMDNFENRIIDFLSVMDTPMDSAAAYSLPMSKVISCPSSSGQTLLHLSGFLGFTNLTRFLIEHGADLDFRDRNGFTPLHLATLAQSKACAAALIQAGADLEIVDSLGKTAKEIASPESFNSYMATRDDLESDEDRSEDEDAELGDAEEDDDVELRRIIQRRVSRRSSRLTSGSAKATPLRSQNASRAATPPPALLPLASDENPTKLGKEKQAESDAADAKRAATFMEKMIQRTLAQIPAPQGIIPNIPQLPLPHLPQFSDLPAVPWGALPQIPMVFPVYVPMMPNWPSFRGGDHTSGSGEDKTEGEGDDAAKNMGGVALRTAQEWRATWEKWVALAVATTARQQQTEDVPPPVYTPRADEEETKLAPTEPMEMQEQPVASTSRRPHPDTRPVGYDSTPVPDQLVESFGYRPNAKQSQRLQKKHDRMLLLFWLPILFLSIIWALHHGLRFAFQAVRMALPAKAILRA